MRRYPPVDWMSQSEARIYGNIRVGALTAAELAAFSDAGGDTSLLDTARQEDARRRAEDAAEKLLKQQTAVGPAVSVELTQYAGAAYAWIADVANQDSISDALMEKGGELVTALGAVAEDAAKAGMDEMASLLKELLNSIVAMMSAGAKSALTAFLLELGIKNPEKFKKNLPYYAAGAGVVVVGLAVAPVLVVRMALKAGTGV